MYFIINFQQNFNNLISFSHQIFSTLLTLLEYSTFCYFKRFRYKFSILFRKFSDIPMFFDANRVNNPPRFRLSHSGITVLPRTGCPDTNYATRASGRRIIEPRCVKETAIYTRHYLYQIQKRKSAVIRTSKYLARSRVKDNNDNLINERPVHANATRDSCSIVRVEIPWKFRSPSVRSFHCLSTSDISFEFTENYMEFFAFTLRNAIGATCFDNLNRTALLLLDMI